MKHTILILTALPLAPLVVSRAADNRADTTNSVVTQSAIRLDYSGKAVWERQ